MPSDKLLNSVVRRRTVLPLPALVLCSVLLGQSALAADMSRLDCDSVAAAQTLAAASHPAPLDASAKWLAPDQLKWVDAPAADQYALYHAHAATLQLQPGQSVGGFDTRIPLTAHASVARSQRASATHSLTLKLPAAQQDAIASLLSGQLVVAALDRDNRVIAATGIQLAALLDQQFAAAGKVSDLGATPSRQHTRFKLWAPTAQQVSLCIYHNGDSKADSLHAMQRDASTGIWLAQLNGDQSERYYTYLVDVYVPNTGIVRNRVTDPYSLSLTTDSRRSYVANLDSPLLKPSGWDSSSRPGQGLNATDLMIYELHVRDFSINDSSVLSNHRGKYLGFTDNRSNGMRHLQALAQAGLTDVHLLPVFDIATIPETRCLTPPIANAAADSRSQQAAITTLQARDCYNWGYDPFHYTAPEGSYASDSKNGAVRIRELRQMVMALHKIGLRVGMDVVYNHTSASGQASTSVLDRIVPGYYQRLSDKGEVETSTCCANTATEHRMMAKLMIDSAVVWARDYHIDSFRFDLMGHQPRAAMEQLQVAVNAASGRHIHLIGEGWNFGEVADGARFVQASQLSLKGSGIGTFSDRARDAVRGGGPADSGMDQLLRQGYLNGLFYAPNELSIGKHNKTDLLRAADLLRVGLAGSLRNYRLQRYDGKTEPLAAIDYAGQPAGYVSEPTEVVNYVENHDNQTLFDVNAFKLPENTSREDRARVQILGAATVAFSQGIAYFHAGQDILRSKSMDRNSFDSGDWFNRIDWTYQDNYFGTGLPPERDNGASWEWMAPRLTNAQIKPRPEDIAWTRDAFRDLLRIRASSSLFRLPSATEIERRLQFLNTGPTQIPTVIVAKLNGDNWPSANFRAVLYALNVEPQTQTLTLPSEIAQPWQLHPVLASAQAADKRPQQAARFDASTGLLTVPARTALVYVLR